MNSVTSNDLVGCGGARGDERNRGEIFFTVQSVIDSRMVTVHLTDEEAEAGTGAPGGLPKPWAVAWGTPHEKLGVVIW